MGHFLSAFERQKSLIWGPKVVQKSDQKMVKSVKMCPKSDQKWSFLETRFDAEKYWFLCVFFCFEPKKTRFLLIFYGPKRAVFAVFWVVLYSDFYQLLPLKNAKFLKMQVVPHKWPTR